MALIAAIIVGIVGTLGGQVNAAFTSVSNGIGSSNQPGPLDAARRRIEPPGLGPACRPTPDGPNTGLDLDRASQSTVRSRGQRSTR